MFFRAALEADLTDDEKTALDKLEEPIRNDPGPHHDAAAFHADLVASTKAGRIENSKLQADEAAFNKGAVAREAEQATALSGLHDALTPEQRKAVVDALRAMQAAHEHPPSTNPSAATDAATRRLERMRVQLNLDADQQKEVGFILARGDAPTPAAVQARFDAGKKQMEAILTAFEKDTFDAKKLDLTSSPGRKPSEPLERQVKYIGQLLPILRPEQRDRFATMMEHPRVDHGHGPSDSIAEPLEWAGGR
jgi:Spy/CpxP family protein refolding chaperone